MKLLFRREAINESIEASNYYEAQRRGLGREFEAVLEAAFATIMEHPTMWPRHGEAVHRYRLRRFPYGIVYRVEPDAVVVLAVTHLGREPGYWQDRM